MHTPELWRVARGCVVADMPFGASDVGVYEPYYGGFMVCESVRPDNARRIVACANACRGLSVDELERGIVGQGFAALEIMHDECAVRLSWVRRSDRLSNLWELDRFDQYLATTRAVLDRAHGRCTALARVTP